MKKRVLIITDSMGAPREEVHYEDTWIYMIKKEFPEYDIIDRPASGSTSDRLVTEGGGGTALLERYHPDIVILQLGITECAPRLFRKGSIEHFFLNRVLPNQLKMKYVNYVKKRRIRNPKITDISPDRFRGNIKDYFMRAMKINAKIIVILISKATQKAISRSPHLEANINLYNNIYKDEAEPFPSVHCITPFDDTIDINTITLDEFHLLPEGSLIICNKIKPYLK